MKSFTFHFAKTPLRTITALLFFIIISSVFWSCVQAKSKPAESSRIIAQDSTFMMMSNGVIIDKKRQLMWARADNGEKISIDGARQYVKNLRLAGYDDWRLPDIRELELLKVHNQTNPTPPSDGCSGNYQIHPFFQLTCCCPWALQDGGTRPAAYPYIKRISGGSMWHHKSEAIGNRVLPVRDME